MSKAVNLFGGGAGGWCLACRDLKVESVGIEMDGPSCATRAAVGLTTIRADVTTLDPALFDGWEGLTASPPCQSFSTAGKGAGLDDPRGQLVHEPMRWVRAIRPRWVALEQVPEVLGYWRWIGRELVELGYSVWTGILNTADYGVPQIRRRAILLASLDRQVAPPEPTHSETGHAELFGAERKRWATMADALGWGIADRPAYTVCGPSDGGHHDGGSGQRRLSRQAQDEGRWLDRRQQTGGAPVRLVPVDEPAPTVTAAPGQWVLRTGTLTEGGDGHRVYGRETTRPAPVVRSNSDRWRLVSPGRSYSSLKRTGDPLTEPAPTVAMGHNTAAWCWERPSTTVQGDPRIAAPGHHERTRDETSIRVEPWELGVLQGFPPDHPWQPPYVARQIGNAVPPVLARACLERLT